jgi:hypothetical protein
MKSNINTSKVRMSMVLLVCYVFNLIGHSTEFLHLFSHLSDIIQGEYHQHNIEDHNSENHSHDILSYVTKPDDQSSQSHISNFDNLTIVVEKLSAQLILIPPLEEHTSIKAIQNFIFIDSKWTYVQDNPPQVDPHVTV